MEYWQFLNEFILTDDSDSSDDEYGFMETENKTPRIKNYVETVVDQYSNTEFRKNFRMERQTFDYILNLIANKISASFGDMGRNTIDAKVQLLLAIWYFATPDSYRSICGRFDVGQATGIRSVRRVTNALFELSSTFIKWPTGQYADEVRACFNAMGFPNAVGCIDGSYIPIPMPAENGRAYICRKNFPCIVLQAVCDHQLLFTHCYAGEVGSVHDAKVLKNSEIWLYMNEQAAEMFANDTHLLGDKAYPIRPELMTPYKDNGHLTRSQTNFNYKLSAARSTIERAFGLLKKRFRCLKFLDVKRVDWIPRYIVACCVLHNICILQNDVIDIDVQNVENDIFVNERIAQEHVTERDRVMKMRGNQKRERIRAEIE